MPGVVTRAQEAAVLLPNEDNLTLMTAKRVRSISTVCRLNSNYALAIDILEIRLNKGHFIAVIDHVSTLLRHTANITVLILVVDRLPRTWQARLLNSVHLPYLWNLTISSSFKQPLRRFLDRHRETLTHLRIDDCKTYSSMDRVDNLPPLSLRSIIGPIDSVAEILPHCAPLHLTIELSGATSITSLQRHGAVFLPHLVTDLSLSLRPRDYNALSAVRAYFPNVDRLKVAEKSSRGVRVWSDMPTWVRALQSLWGLSRLVLETSQAVPVEHLPVRSWFRRAGPTTLRVVEFWVAQGALGTWRRDHGTTVWYFVRF